MIALFLLAAAADPPATLAGLPVGVLAQQALPAKGCAAYLFTGGQPRSLVAMASADAASLRFVLDGVTTDYARVDQTGGAAFGFAAATVYRAGAVTATLEMTIAPRGDLTQGAAVPEATLRIDRAGQDGIVLPLAGLVGCAS